MDTIYELTKILCFFILGARLGQMLTIHAYEDIEAAKKKKETNV